MKGESDVTRKQYFEVAPPEVIFAVRYTVHPCYSVLVTAISIKGFQVVDFTLNHMNFRVVSSSKPLYFMAISASKLIYREDYH